MYATVIEQQKSMDAIPCFCVLSMKATTCFQQQIEILPVRPNKRHLVGCPSKNSMKTPSTRFYLWNLLESRQTSHEAQSCCCIVSSGWIRITTPVNGMSIVS